jgi:predicted dehydrogenase
MIGRGFMGTTHLNSYAQVPEVEVVAVCPATMRARSGNLGNANDKPLVPEASSIRKCAGWRELIEVPELDAVDICLPTDMHADVAVAALAAGKHVLCEKPMALASADCDRMIAAAEQNDRILMIGQVLRFWPEYRALESFVKSGEHGRIRSALFVRRCGVPDWSPWLADESRSGGAVIDLLIHDIDQALLLFGAPDRVAAKSIGGGPDTLMATLIYPDGPEVRIQGGWFQAGTPLSMSFQVRADRAELEWTPQGLMLSGQTGERKRIEVAQGGGYDAEIAYFVDCCRNNRRPEQCIPQDSARALRIALAFKASRDEGGAQVKCLV